MTYTTKKLGRHNPKRAVHIAAQPNEPDHKAIARALLQYPMQAADTIGSYLKIIGEIGTTNLLSALHKQVDAVNRGDMEGVETLLVSQAYTLDAIFHRLAQRAINAEYLPQFEANLKLALRAQNQCRATLETLSVIKNPPNVAFVKQANIAHNQQVNNGPQASQPAAIDSPRSQLVGTWLLLCHRGSGYRRASETGYRGAGRGDGYHPGVG